MPRKSLVQQPKKDKRDCPKCAGLGWDDAKTVRMEQKATLQDGIPSPPQLWQCPECKNVEVLY